MPLKCTKSRPAAWARSVNHSSVSGFAEGVEPAFNVMRDRLSSTHIHDNDGKADKHLFPLLAEGGSIDWKETMNLLRTRADQYPLLLELKEAPEFSLASASEVFERLEDL